VGRLEKTSMSDRFCYYVRVRYGECDAQKVVFNARYADYVDLSTTEFIRALGFGEALINGTFDYQLVKLTIEWKAPARFDQVLELTCYAKHLGNTSFTVATEFRIAGQEPILAMAETVYVLVEAHTLRKKPLPADLRAALQAGAPGAITDHAGYVISPTAN
jgi:acyl-CoA thioester hydrolase